jgi:hypothetical protein
MHGRDEKCIKTFIGGVERNRQHGRSRRRWEDNIITDLKAVVWDGVDRLHPAQDRDQWRVLVKAVMKFRVSIKCGLFLD